jgi:amino acid adenylation domain-containing protein/non-ribosomal peptide synthase protein (TIGR01720 family)
MPSDAKTPREPIAVIGIGCRFPGAPGPDAFWALLRDGVDAIAETPAGRPGLAPPALRGGFLAGIERFDAAFFGISRREAVRMDPQQRLLLEIAWEALEDAGQTLTALAGSDAGVFLGIGSDDYREIAGRCSGGADLHASTGGCRGAAAGRLSHALGLTGPSLAVDSDRSASLVAVHLACQSLWSGECSLTLAGGVSLILRPETGLPFAQAGLLAADGRCKAFSARADGIVRSEGAGLVVLKPLARALADGDPVRAVIRGSAVNNDGSGPLMTPSRAGQEAVLRAACRAAGLAPHEVDYVEAHGTGTPVGDRVEAEALAAVAAAGRPAARPCLVGSVKTNIGHTEAAAGIAGLIKTVLCLENRTIPASLHCAEPHPDLPWRQAPLAVAATAQPWPERAGLQGRLPARAGVSSFGMAGTNAHVILEEAPAQPAPAGQTASGPLLIPLSARGPRALAARARAWLDALPGAATARLADVAYTAAVRRTHLADRLAVVARTAGELAEALDAFLRGEPHAALASRSRPAAARRRLVLVFPGHGAWVPETGRQLLDGEPVFRAALERCDTAVRRCGGPSPLAALAGGGALTEPEWTAVHQPLCFSFQVALAALWRSWGIAPDAVLGHSLGEVAAACVAGALDLDDAARVVVERSRAVAPARGHGGMMVAELPPEAAHELIAGHPGLAFAGSNSPGSSLLSGAREALDEALEALSRRGVFARRVRLDYASHSPAMDPLLGGLRASLAGLAPRAGTVAFHSSVRGGPVAGADLGAGYWVDNLRQPVSFSAAVQRLLAEGCDLFLEIGARPVLLPALRSGLAGREGAAAVASLRRGEDERTALLQALAALYASGADIAWQRLYPDGGRCVPLPAYPWQRERYWIDEDGAEEAAVPGETGEAGRHAARGILAELRRRAGAVLRTSPDRLDTDLPLTALGLDSLLALELEYDLEAELGLAVPARDLLSGRSLAELAAGLETRSASPAVLPARPATAADGLLLSTGQQALWFLHRLAPESPAYNLSLGLRTARPLDLAALRRAFAALTERHPALRATFTACADGTPAQRIHRSPAADFAVLDAGGDAGSDADGVRRLFTAEANRPFALDSTPPVRLRAACCAEGHALLLVVHHIVADFASLGILGSDLGALYARETGAPAPPPAPAENACREHLLRQRELLSGAAGERQWLYWRSALQGCPVELALPVDRPRPPVQGFRGAAEPLRLDAGTATAVRSFARSRGTTLFTVLLSAFQALLHRITGQDDLLVGTPASERTPTLAGTVGYFVNPLALRSRLTGEPPFADFLEQSRRTVLDALEHRDFPFPLLVERLHAARDASRSPLFQVMFAFEQAARPEEQPLAACLLGLDGVPVSLGGLSAVSLRLAEQASQLDLTLRMAEVDGSLAACLVYDTDLFQAVSIHRMLACFATLLGAAVAAPEMPVSELPLLTPQERHQLLVEPAGAGSPLPPPLCLPDLFALQSARTPDAVALVAGEERITYRALQERCNRLAARLRGLGAGPEVRVGLFVERGASLIAGMLAILEAGGAYVPLDPTLPRERLAFLLADAGITVLLTRQGLAGRLPACGVRLAFLDGDGRADGEPASAAATAAPGRRAGAGNLAYLIYTSGSTGRPKAVAIEHRSAAALVHWAHRAFSPEELAGVLAATSISFDLSVFEIFAPLCGGGTVLLADNALSLPGLAARDAVTLVSTVPSALAELVRLQTLPPSVRTVNLAGEPLTRPLAEAIHGLGTVSRLLNLYGPSEDTTYSTFARIPASDAQAPAIGRPLDGTCAYLLDARLQPVPPGVPGEIHLNGAGLARGYLGRPELTAERFVPNPFATTPGDRLYKTGDRARRRPGGDLDFLGRADHQVKIRGFRIEAGEIETALRCHPAVRDALVMAREDIPGHRQLVGYVVADPAAGPLAPAAIKAFLRDRLPEPLVPAFLVPLDALPLNHNGKVDRQALPRPDLAAAPPPPAAGAPLTPVQEALARLWCRVLRVDRVGLHDDFFALGGDSILGIQIVAQAAREGLRLSPQDFFRHKTVERLAAVVEVAAVPGAGPGPATGAVHGAAAGPVPLTPIQRWFLDSDPAEPWHFNQAVLLCLAPAGPPVAPPLLERALDHLVRRHDALRLRFTRTAAGWEQTAAGGADPVPFCRIDLSALPGPAATAALESACARLQASLDLESGPLLCAAWLDLGAGRPARLLLAIHHLAVDGVSWRILLADLEAVCGQLAAGAAAELPPGTSLFATWARALAAHAASAELRAEAGAWCSPPRRIVPLPLDLPNGPEGANTRASERTLAVSLTTAETRRLLREVPAAYRTRINDVLLTALALSFARWTGGPALWLDLEGHGREEIAAGLDLSRTVGWLTALFPVALEVDAAAGPAAALKGVKERLRAVPRNGIGFGLLRYLGGGAELADLPAREVCFNYLGQLDAWLDGSALFRKAPESPGPFHSRCGVRRHALELNGWISGGRLRVAWTFSRNLHRSATVKAVARGFLRELRGLIDHCCGRAAAGYTPSDFPLAGLGQEDLDALLGGERGIESVAPLTPVQEGMLFHTLTAPRPGVYVQQVLCSLGGPLDEAAFRRAWQGLAERHGILRTSFAWQGLTRPLQIVHARAELAWELHDWRGTTEDEQEERLRALLAEDRLRGFDLTRAPLLRFTLVRRGESSWRLLWSHHHILLDGWSVQVLLGELMQSYDDLRHGVLRTSERPLPFHDFVDWLERQDPAPAAAFWRRSLAGVAGDTAPTPLPLARSAAPERDGSPERRERSLRLDAEATAALAAFARSHQLTLNTLVHGAWALLLARSSGHGDVLFGTTSSGRPAGLPGAGAAVGLFISTLPVRVRIEPQTAVLPWLQALQDDLAEIRRHEHTPLVRIRAWSGMPASRALFSSLLVFESYPPAARAPQGPGALTLEGLRFLEAPHDPLTVVAVPGPQLTLQVLYDPARFDAAAADLLLESLRLLLTGMAADPQRRLADLPALPPLPLLPGTARDRSESITCFGPHPAAFTAPLSEVEHAIAAIWRESLHVERVGRHDNFFDAGGNSLLLFRVHGMIRQRLGCDLSLGDFMDHPTLSDLACHLDHDCHLRQGADR